MKTEPSALMIRDYLANVYAPAIQNNLDAYLVGSYTIRHDSNVTRWVSESFHVTKLDEAAAWFANCNELHDVYYRVSLVGEPVAPGKRGTARETRWLTHYACDVDYGKEGHSATNLVGTLGEAVHVIDATLKASMTVSSGGGAYGIYRLTDPFAIAQGDDDSFNEALTLGRRLDDALNRNGTADKVNNLANVIRPVGSVNRKYPEPRQVTYFRAPTRYDYNFTELGNRLPFSAQRVGSTKSSETSDPFISDYKTNPQPIARVFNARITWEQIFEADTEHGWTRNDNGTWKRSGVDVSKETLEPIGDDLMKVRSTTIAAEWGIEGGTELDRFGLACLVLGFHPKKWRENVS